MMSLLFIPKVKSECAQSSRQADETEAGIGGGAK